MNVTDITYSSDEVKDMSDKELYQLLYKSWNITNSKIEVWGRLKLEPPGKWAGIYDVKTITENREIRYPIELIRNIDESGVFTPPNYAKSLLGDDTSIWIRCELELANKDERKKQGNPFHLSVKKDSAQRLVSMPIDKNDIINGDATGYISKVIYDSHLAAVSTKVKKEQTALELELSNIERKHVQATAVLGELSEQNNGLEESNEQLQSEIDIRQDELATLTHEYQKVEQKMSKKIEKLKSYITEKAQFLKDFEFVDEEDFETFIYNVTKGSGVQNGLSFQEAFDGDYTKAVSYIQAYLKEQDILYPRHIIENYLTLIRCNDLIILAGDSGSGKTNLVHSFAKAVGGVSKIIPVKPNWTSSEDLLGYYNPLEKKYLSTPFLEALIEAQQNPAVPYFICLDEMNLARVEYYFADFLSKLETRDATPEIQLYSDDESAHILSELKAVVAIISDAKAKYARDGIVDFVKLMQDKDVNAEMKRAFGFSDKDSLIKYHGDIRRMLSGIISTPSTIRVPANVRIIGAINIDETTHYLSPKILDRAHIMKFKSPLLTDWDDIFSEIENYGFADVSKPIHFDIDALGERETYPKFDRNDPFCSLFISLNKEFFNPIGVEFGMRTIRQGLNYLTLFADVNDDREQAINNFIIHKVLPKFTFDGSKQAGNYNKLDLLANVLLPRLESIVTNHETIAEEFSSVAALKSIIENAKANDNVANYWA